MSQYVVGLDVGGTTVKCGIFDVAGVEKIRKSIVKNKL